MIALPFLTVYDPPGSSEGTLDPLGLYLLADQLATRLVPAIRERMQRVRFLTAITVGALVTENLEPNPNAADIPPYLVWEWLVVESIVRSSSREDNAWGVPGSQVGRKAVARYGYVDQRSYLKTPRVFGFHGVYKRLAMHLGLIDERLRFCAPRGEELVRRWCRGQGEGRFDSGSTLFRKWRAAVERSLRASPVRTKPGWSRADWRQMAEAFLPDGARGGEKTCLRRFLHSETKGYLGALADLWRLFEEGEPDKIDERAIHRELGAKRPNYSTLLEAITAYESFARTLTDAFDLLRAEATGADARGYAVTAVAADDFFRRLASRVHDQFREAIHCLNEVDAELEAIFLNRFERFGEPIPAAVLALRLCEHHEAIQGAKSRDGKRPWFGRVGDARIYVRRNYLVAERPEPSERYVHFYRSFPIYRFYQDLA